MEKAAPGLLGAGRPSRKGAKSQTRTGFVTLNNCLLYGPSSVALCQQPSFSRSLVGPEDCVFLQEHRRKR